MKHYILITYLLALPFVTFGQTSATDKLFDQYSGKKGYTSVYITHHMFDLFSKIETDEEDEEFMDVVSGLNGIKILTLSDEFQTPEKSLRFYKMIQESLPENEYKELMIVKEEEEEVKFFIREKGDKITELLMIVKDKKESLFLTLSGDIDLKKISKLSKSMKIDGLEHLDKIEEE